MSRAVLVLAALAAPASALAMEPGESNSETVLFTGEVNLFDGIEEAIGYGIGDEATGVRIEATADVRSDLSFSMEGLSDLEWPEALQNSWDQTEAEGQLILRNTAELRVVIRGTILDIDLGFELFKETLEWENTIRLDSILLEGTRQGPTESFRSDGEAIVGFDERIVINEDNGWYIDVGGDVQPSLLGTITATGIQSGDGLVTQAGDYNLVEVPNQNDGFVDFPATWVGELSGDIGIALVPEVEFTIGRTIIGPIRYPINIDLFSDTKLIESEPSVVSHDLPAAVPGARTLDFGQVVIGDSSTVDFVLENMGNVELAGTARVESQDGSFVMPDANILIARTNDGPNEEQVLSIDFLPADVGNFTGTLVIETNDPVQPEITIPMAGAGIEPPTDDPDGDPNNPGDGDDLVSQPGRGCGCATTSPAGGLGAMAFLGLFGLMARRRRR